MAATLAPARLTLERYHELIDAGFFDGAGRMELIEGVLVEMSPKGPEHDDAVDWLTMKLARSVPEPYVVRVQGALTDAPSGSEPEPDLLVYDGTVARRRHPATGPLAIEVSASSLIYDRRVKTPLYAAAGLVEYWIVNLIDRVVEVHRDPAADGYAHTSVARPGEALAPASIPDLPALDVAALFRAAFAHAGDA